MSGHVSYELAPPEANSDQAHKYLSSRNPEAPGYHCLSWLVPFYSKLQVAPKEIFQKCSSCCQALLEVPESCLQISHFLQVNHISYFLQYDKQNSFGGSSTDQLEANFLLALSLV